MEFEFSLKATGMYQDFLTSLVTDTLDNSVLTTTNASFMLKKAWQDQAEGSKNVKVNSLRFSSEIGLLVEIITSELNELKDKNATNKKSKQGNTHEEQVALRIFGLIFNRMIKKITSSTETLMLYLYPYLRESKKQILIEEAMSKQGNTYMELVKVINFFFSDMDE
mmetsp:Transcript_7761/g.10953  ORF Transcript_7761/g.10953 Transcript_7761/m.10953 type:complete len:166 (-) Transcript_7761:2018-2515(-)